MKNFINKKKSTFLKITPGKKNLHLFVLILFLFFQGCRKSNNNENIWVEGFQQVSPMMMKRSGAAGVKWGEYLYIFGGIDGKDFLKTTERVKINPDGTLGKWIKESPLNINRGFFYALEHNGFIYVLGGANGDNGKNLLSSIERAKINPDGSLQPWMMESEVMTSVRRCSKAVVIDGSIYAVGGYNGGFIEYTERAKINSDGSLAKWALEKNTTSIGRYIHGLTKVGKRIFAIGGHNETKGTGLNDIEWTDVKTDGSIKKWQKSNNSLMQRRYGHTVFTNGDYLFAAGGMDRHLYLGSVEYSRLGANALPGEWRFTAPFKIPRESAVTLLHNKKLYVIGGSNIQGFQKSVEMTTIKNDGSLGYWLKKKDAELLVKNKKAKILENKLYFKSSENEYFYEGNSYMNTKKYQMALVAYKKVITLNPDFLDAYQNLSTVYLRLKMYKDSIITLNRIIKKKKDYTLAYYNKACAYALQNKKENAISSLLEAIKYGYNDLEKIETDSDLNNIRNSPGYKKVIRKVILTE